MMNWCDNVIRKKPQREPHPQNVTVGLESGLPDYKYFNRRDINVMNWCDGATEKKP